MGLGVEERLKLGTLVQHRPQLFLVKIKVSGQSLYPAAYDTVIGSLEQAEIIISYPCELSRDERGGDQIGALAFAHRPVLHRVR